MSRVADTSFLYALFDRGDERHEQAKKEFAKPQALHVPLPILAEFLALLTLRHDRETALDAHDDLFRLPTVGILPVREEEEVVRLWRNEGGLSVADAAAIRATMETGSRLLTFDRQQAKVLARLRKDRPR